MAATGGKKQWKTSVFWKKDPDPDSGIVKVLAPGVNLELPVTTKQPMVRMPVHIRRPRVVTLNRSSLVSQNATRVAKHESSSEIDTIPTRDTGSKSDKTNSPEEKRTKLTLRDLSAEDKRRVANLVRELARVGEERELALTQLKEERSAFEERLEILQQEYDAVIHEKEYMQNRFLELQTLLKKYKSPEKGGRIPSHRECSNVGTLSEGSKFQVSPVRTGVIPELESIKGNSRPVPGTPTSPTKGKVSLLENETQLSSQVLPPHKGGTAVESVSIPPTSAPPISGPLPNSGGTSEQQLKSISGKSSILAPITSVPTTQSVVLHPGNLPGSGNSGSSKLGTDCHTTQAMRVQVTSRPQSASVIVSQSAEVGEEDISNLPQFYHLDAVPVRQGFSFHPPADSHKAAAAPDSGTAGLQVPTQQEFQGRYSDPAYANRLFDHNVVESSWRTLPKRSVDRSLTESTVSQAVSAELDAVYRLHCREYELQLQLQQQQLELQRQQLQLQQQLQQLEVIQQQNRPPPAQHAPPTQAQPAASVEEVPHSAPVPRSSSQPRQVSPGLSLIPTPDVEKTSLERLSQVGSRLSVDAHHDISRDQSAASQPLTGECTVELYKNSGMSTEHSRRYYVQNKENVNSVEHGNTSSQHLHTAHNTPRPGVGQSIVSLSSESQRAQMPELIEETLLESRGSSRMSLGRTGNEAQGAPPFVGLAADSQWAQATLVREGHGTESRASSRATTVLPLREAAQMNISMPAGQPLSHLNARRDDSFRVSRTGSKTSERSKDSVKELEGRYYYSLYQEPDSAISVRTMDGDRDRDRAGRVAVGFSREEAPENQAYEDEQRFVHVQRIPQVTSETAVSSLNNQDPRRLHSVYSFGPESTGQVRGAGLHDTWYSLHSSSFMSGKSDLEAVRQSHGQEFTRSSQKHDSSFRARSVQGNVYPETLVNIVQDLEYSEYGQPGDRGSYQRPPSVITDGNEGSARQPEARSYLQGTTGKLLAVSETERLRGLHRPFSGTVHERELGLRSEFLFDRSTSDIVEERPSLDTSSPAFEDTGNVERRSEGLAARNSDMLTVQQSTSQHSWGPSHGAGGTDTADSGYSQDSYRDRSPLTSNREYWDLEQEEADVLTEIFFTNSRKR